MNKKLFLSPLAVLLWAMPLHAQETVKRFQGNFNGTDQVVIAAPGAGKKICLRSLTLSTEDSNTDWRFFAKNGILLVPTAVPTATLTPTPTTTPVATPTATVTPTATPTSAAVTPNEDFLSNSGVVLPPDESCWFMLGENQALVVTSNNPVDLFGTYKILPK